MKHILKHLVDFTDAEICEVLRQYLETEHVMAIEKTAVMTLQRKSQADGGGFHFLISETLASPEKDGIILPDDCTTVRVGDFQGGPDDLHLDHGFDQPPVLGGPGCSPGRG